MKSLIHKDQSIESLEEELKTIYELVSESTTTEELFDIEQMIGIQVYLGCDDWDLMPTMLRKLRSPYADVYQQLVYKWEEIDEI